MAQAETDIFSGLAKFLGEWPMFTSLGWAYDLLIYLCAESRPEVKDVKLTSGQPATTSETSSWERVSQKK